MGLDALQLRDQEQEQRQDGHENEERERRQEPLQEALQRLVALDDGLEERQQPLQVLQIAEAPHEEDGDRPEEDEEEHRREDDEVPDGALAQRHAQVRPEDVAGLGAARDAEGHRVGGVEGLAGADGGLEGAEGDEAGARRGGARFAFGGETLGGLASGNVGV